LHDPGRTSTSSRSTSEDATRDFAQSVGTQVNLVNLRENIAPTRGRAHLVLEKGHDHAIGRGPPPQALSAYFWTARHDVYRAHVNERLDTASVVER